MFSVCLFTGGAPRGTSPPPNKFGQKCWTKFGTKNGQRFGQKIGQTFWKLLEVGGGGRGRYASCGHAGGLSCFDYILVLVEPMEFWRGIVVGTSVVCLLK